jgi:hypothetical protein
MSGSWSYYFQTNSAQYAINAVIEMMKESIKPLLNSNLVDFYEVVDRASQKRLEVVYSKKGQEEKDNWHNQNQKCVAHLKWLNQVLMKNYPHAQKWIDNEINHVGSRISGGGIIGKEVNHPNSDIQPQNNKIPLNTIKETIKISHGSFVLEFFLDAVKTDDENKYKIMEIAAQKEKPGFILYSANLLINHEWEDQKPYGHPLNHLYDSLTILKEKDILEKICPRELDQFSQHLENAINHDIDFNDLVKSDIMSLKELSKYLDINPKIVDAVTQLDEKFKKEEQDRKQRDQQVRRKRKFIIEPGNVKYITKDNMEWENIPSKYINYHGEIDYGWFAKEIIDHEDISYDAYEKAMEKAHENAEERPSETYGEDKEEVEGDIGYDFNDFINDKSLEDLPENASDDEWIEVIKEKYFDDFVAWKKQEIKKREDEESWRYEPEEPDEDDLHKIENELAEEVAFEQYGLVIVFGEENRDIRLEFNSKFTKQVMPVIKETVQTMLKEKDEENDPLLKSYNKVIFDYRDQTSRDQFNIYDLIRKV